MTEQQAIEKVVETANSQVGYREGADNYNKYAAELDPMGLTYGSKQNCAWCGEFILWLFVKCFGADAALKTLCSPKPTGIPLCSAAAKYFKDAGRWTSKPSVGNIVFFIYDGGINHMGTVTGVSSLSITTVEGNSSDMVSRRTYAIGNASIAGYGIPKWSVVATENSDSEKNDATSSEIPVDKGEDNNVPTIEGLPQLSKGSKGEVVRAAQILLIGRGYTCGSYGADGDFGNATLAAVKNFQRVHNLAVDGIIGAETWAALLGL